MGLFDSDAGKRRLLSVEIPILERYNAERAGDFKVKVVRQGKSLLLRYRLKPMHNVYELETRLPSDYPMLPPETRVVTPLSMCPHLLDGQLLCMWRQGSTRETSRWRNSHASSPCRPRGAGSPATKSGTTPANGRCRRRADLVLLEALPRTPEEHTHWLISSKSAQARAA
jgi:hypothetical protein